MKRWFAAAACVLGLAGFAAGGEDAKVDSLLIDAQKICPVSGRALGSMGQPVKAEIAGREVFLCCAGCKGKPAAPEHWAAMRRNQATAQGLCPVMGTELSEDAPSVVVLKRELFVCCPPCIKKIKAAPEKYVGVVEKHLAAEAKAKASKAENSQ